MKDVSCFQLSERLTAYLERIPIIQLNIVQCEALLSGLLEGRDILVSSPSGSGKTLIGELACVNALFTQGGKVLFLVPLKAIANEKFEEFHEKLAPENIKVGISTGDFRIDVTDIEDASFLVMTYERFDTYLRQKEKRVEWIEELRVVVMDEIQILNDAHRGPRIESVIARIKSGFPDVQVVSMSGTLANAGELAAWLDAELIESSYRPVPLSYEIIECSNKDQAVNDLLEQLAPPILLYVQTRRGTEQAARKLAKHIKEAELLSKRDQRRLQGAYAKIKFEHDHAIDPKLLEMLSRGVAFHHGGMSMRSRKLVEQAVTSEPLKIVCCTSTLAAGINTPVKSVIVRDVELRITELKYSPKARATIPNSLMVREVEPNLFHQIIGRAGRPQFGDKHAKGIILVSNTEEKQQVIRHFFHKENGRYVPKYNRVSSKFNNLEVLKEQVLVHLHDQGGLTRRELENAFSRTFWWYEVSQQHPDTHVRDFIELTSLSMIKTVHDFAHPQYLERARNFTDKQLRPKNFYLRTDYVKGIFRDPTMVTAIIGREYVHCSCPTFKDGSDGMVLCPHVLRLFLEGIKHDEKLVSAIFTKALRKEFVMNYLAEQEMIQRDLKGTYKCTGFGSVIVTTYLHPSSAVFISRFLPSVRTEMGLIELISKLYAQESSRPDREDRFAKGVASLIDSKGVNYYQRLREVARQTRVGLGDLEEYLSYTLWCLECIARIAKNRDNSPAEALANMLLFEMQQNFTPPRTG